MAANLLCKWAKECQMFAQLMTSITPEPPIPPVLPPDDPNEPDVTRLPNIDPPPTVPDRNAPSENPRLPPPEPMTT
jgi:hypothetical protein